MRRKICYKKEWKEKYDKKDTHDNVLVTLNCYSFKPIAYRGGEGNWGLLQSAKSVKAFGSSPKKREKK